MNELQNTTKLVRQILEEDEKARNSDNYLIIKVYERLYPPVANMPFNVVLNHRNDYGLPSFETIRRTRQKLQHDYPELAACDAVRINRAIREDEFKEYARD